jgi:hypothetical protein
MKRIAVLLAVALALVFSGAAMAERTASGTADVYVTVDPNIAVRPLVPSVNMGMVQMGKFIGFIPWRIDANTQNIKIWGAASYLYKGDDPTDPTVPPIMLDQTYGIHFDIADGGPIGGEDNVLQYINAVLINGFPGMETAVTEYESSTAGHLSQDCLMSVQWNQENPERPMGEYSGVVRLSTMVILF